MDLNNSVGNKIFEAGEVFTGTPSKIKDLSNTIKVSYHGANGVLRIYQSPNGKLWSYYEEFTISGNSFAQSGINGNYYYVQYTNVTGTNTITIATNLSQQIHDNFNVQLNADDTVTVSGLTFNEDGALIVASTGGGGGLSADVNVTNTSLDVNVLNQLNISALATSVKQDSILSDLDTIANTLAGTLKVIEEPLITTEPVFLDFDENSAQVIGDSPDGGWYNPDDEVEGWGYANLTVGGAQVYYYTNTGLVANATEPNITLGSVTTGWCIASLNTITTTDNTWIMNIYTKPTGSGDAQFWYKSRRAYQVTSSFPLSKAVDYLFYWGQNPVNVHPELQHVEMALSSTQGTAADSEIVQFMSLNVPSTVPQFQFVGRVKRAGYIRSGVSREVHFLNSNSIRAERRLHQLKFNTLVENEGQGALFVNVENQISGFATESSLSSLNGKVLVCDTGNVSVSNQISGFATESSLSSLNGKVLVCDTGNVSVSNQISGFATESSLSSLNGKVLVCDTGNVSVSNQISGFATESSLSSLNGKVMVCDTGNVTLLNQISGFALESTLSALNGKVLVCDTGNVTLSNQISGFATESSLSSLNGKVLVCDTGNVTLTNQISGFATESTLSSLNGKVMVCDTGNVTLTNQISGFATESTLSSLNGKVIQCDTGNVTISNQISGFSTESTLASLNGKVTICDTGNVTLSNQISGFATESTLSSLNGKVIQCDTGNTNIINSSLDTHLFGLHNATWTAVSVASNGHFMVNSSTQDGDGNDITSTAVTGTETYRALDVKCRGTTTISGEVTASLETGNGPLTSSVDDDVNALDVSVKNVVSTNLRTSTGGLLTSTSISTKNALDVAVQNTPSVKATQYGSFGNLANNIASILPAGSTAGIDVSDWSYFIGYYEDYYSGPFPSGSLRIQYSFDNITYYNIFNTQIFPSGTGTPRTGTITKQDIPGINWIRFYNDTNATMISVTITLLGASL
jgi:hypothetical protein